MARGCRGWILAGNFLEQSARKQVLQPARLMMAAPSAMRIHTSQVGPLLQAHQAQINTLPAQTVPAYAATDCNCLRTDYPDNASKEATLNPTSLRRGQANVIQAFRNHPDRKEFAASAIHPEDDLCSWQKLSLAASEIPPSDSTKVRNARSAMPRGADRGTETILQPDGLRVPYSFSTFTTLSSGLRSISLMSGSMPA
jgi:hypothetical protein